MSEDYLISIKPFNNQWEVEYESYFNPHANPKQLMDKKLFDSLEEAIDWAKAYIQDYYEIESCQIENINVQYPSNMVVEDVSFSNERLFND